MKKMMILAVVGLMMAMEGVANSAWYYGKWRGAYKWENRDVTGEYEVEICSDGSIIGNWHWLTPYGKAGGLQGRMFEKRVVTNDGVMLSGYIDDDWGEYPLSITLYRDRTSEFTAQRNDILVTGNCVRVDQTEEGSTIGSVARIYNGIVYDSSEKMLGIVQVSISKKDAKDNVKVSGFAMLQDGKKQTIKAVTTQVSGGYLKVSTTVGKVGNLAITLGGNGFTGSLGDMTVASADVDENTGIMSATVKVQYFDAKTGKLKSKSYKMSGVTSGGEAVGTATLKSEVKTFEAVIE